MASLKRASIDLDKISEKSILLSDRMFLGGLSQWIKKVKLFLPAAVSGKGKGRLHVSMVSEIWNAICQVVNVKGKTPRLARHAMGKHIIEKTGNIATVQKQLGH